MLLRMIMIIICFRCLRKKIERAFKIYVTRKDPDGLSVMHPEPYKVEYIYIYIYI